MNPLTVVTKAIAQRDRCWLQPSLLLLAEIAVVALLWSVTVAPFLYDSNKLTELVRYDEVFACHRGRAASGGRPRAPVGDFKTVDLALLETSSDFACEPDKAPVIQVWQRGRLIYNATEAMPATQTSSPGRIETIRIGHRVWRAHHELAAAGYARAAGGVGFPAAELHH
jgi:hypothetical protein